MARKALLLLSVSKKPQAKINFKSALSKFTFLAHKFDHVQISSHLKNIFPNSKFCKCSQQLFHFPEFSCSFRDFFFYGFVTFCFKLHLIKPSVGSNYEKEHNCHCETGHGQPPNQEGWAVALQYVGHRRCPTCSSPPEVERCRCASAAIPTSSF